MDDSSGRILSLLFSMLLAGALVWLVREERDWGIFAGLLAMLALLATPVFAFQMVAGLTDVPVAAFIALTGALVWGRRPTPARAVAAAGAAALAMLTKPSALLALVGLALAQLLVSESWRGRLLYRIAPICAGLAAGLAYDLTQARYVHQGLRTFLQAGVNTDYYRALADEARRYAIFDGNWFGDGLRVAAFFALLYAVLRLTGIGHRISVLVGVPCALLASWLGPWFAAHQDRSLWARSIRRVRRRPHSGRQLSGARPPHGSHGDSVSRETRALCHLSDPTAVAWAVWLLRRACSHQRGPHCWLSWCSRRFRLRVRLLAEVHSRWPYRSHSSPWWWLRMSTTSTGCASPDGTAAADERLARSRPDARDCPAAQPGACDREEGDETR